MFPDAKVLALSFNHKFLTYLPLVPHICISGSALVQAMACRLLGAKPLPGDQCWCIVKSPGNKFQWHLNQNSIIFMPEYAFKMLSAKLAAILFRGRWVKVTAWMEAGYCDGLKLSNGRLGFWGKEQHLIIVMTMCSLELGLFLKWHFIMSCRIFHAVK